MVVSCSRWFGFRIDLLSSLFITIVGVAATLVNENPGELVQAHILVEQVQHRRYHGL